MVNVRRFSVMTMVLFLLFLVPQHSVAFKNSTDTPNPDEVFLVNDILKNKWGKSLSLVSVYGRFNISLEHVAICKEKFSIVFAGDINECIWVEIDPGPYNTPSDIDRSTKNYNNWLLYNGQSIVIEGTLDAMPGGHLGVYPATILYPPKILNKLRHQDAP